MSYDKYPFPLPCGYTTIYSFLPDGTIVNASAGHNEIMYGLIEAAARLFAGGSTYKAAALYFEFQNLVAASDTPDYPSFTAADGIEYYTGLQYSVDRDFVRVPILSEPGVSQIGDSTWRMSVHAITPDVSAGYWGRTFSAVANSVVIGGALVASPTPDNQSQDIVLCRNYPAGTKVPKAAGEQIAMTWNVEFTMSAGS